MKFTIGVTQFKHKDEGEDNTKSFDGLVSFDENDVELYLDEIGLTLVMDRVELMDALKASALQELNLL